MSASLVNELIAAADALPAHLRDWIVAGFQKWQLGQPLEDALVLDGSDDAPDMDLDERDDMVVFCINAAPGESRAARIVYFIECMDGALEHDDDTARRFIRALRSSRVYVPGTIRHLRRIMNSRRQDAWYLHGTPRWLCPTDAAPDTGDRLNRTGT